MRRSRIISLHKVPTAPKAALTKEQRSFSLTLKLYGGIVAIEVVDEQVQYIYRMYTTASELLAKNDNINTTNYSKDNITRCNLRKISNKSA